MGDDAWRMGVGSGNSVQRRGVAVYPEGKPNWVLLRILNDSVAQLRTKFPHTKFPDLSSNPFVLG